MSRRTRSLVVAAVAALSLVACSAPLPQPHPDAAPAAVQPAVSTDQVDRVLAGLASTLESADGGAGAAALDARLTGPAKTLRAVEYQLAAAGDTSALRQIPAAAQTRIAPATKTWPRTVFVVTEPPADLTAPLLLTLVQQTPRDQFKLWSWVRLFPGVQVPATAKPDIGSAPVPMDAATLVASPADVIAHYVDVLTNGAASPFAASFTPDDPLRTGIAGVRAQYASVVTEKGSLTETYQPYEGGAYAIATADGGAIVVGAIQTVTTISLADSTLTLGGPAAALLGKPTVASSLAITWLSTVAFAVPPAGSPNPITVLGGEHSPIQVTGE
ncbi:MAG TPA: hypothetical protein VGK35_13200 [Actinotalea sp.]